MRNAGEIARGSMAVCKYSERGRGTARGVRLESCSYTLPRWPTQTYSFSKAQKG
eukprot:CAMPEP_0181251140 /NCGR_PEP_ID=MMETSP1096-20121128/46710_1 /TAXON_ID=156174 ORGANISM="Chrysochromulina ericina, Strain CCMP281" /NCGR_SAMPLE_ID=MMETSP1096 /ASSEMBLY_ACC=CAM_ASM_000453 /LENGTH=53 /DNA_ID=CAMNT_0023348687 /DNA_START=758 /DNA_END=919 /DNA_ORIENTATION=-